MKGLSKNFFNTSVMRSQVLNNSTFSGVKEFHHVLSIKFFYTSAMYSLNIENKS